MSESARSKIESRFLTVTSIVVTLIAVPAFFSIVSEPLTEVELQSLDSRAPASEDKVQNVSFKDKAKSAVIVWDCKHEATAQQVTSQRLRIVGKNCGDSFKDFSVINTSNGFTASIVKTDVGFTTDFIHLNNGINELLFESSGPKGELRKLVLKVTNRLPASE